MFRVISIKFVASLALLLILSCRAYCQEVNVSKNNPKTEDLTQLITGVRDKILEKQSIVERLNQEKTNLQDSLKKVSDQLSRSKSDADKSKKDIEEISKEKENINLSLQGMENSIDSTKDKLRKKIRYLYKTAKKLPAISYLGNSNTEDDFLIRGHYMYYLITKDKKNIGDYVSSIRALEQKQITLNKLNEDSRLKYEELSKQAAEFELSKVKFQKILKELADFKQKQMTALIELEKSQVRLERTLAKIMGATKKIQARNLIDNTTEVDDENSQFVSNKGKFEWPVDGRIIQPFGARRHDEFLDVVFVNGIEFSASEGASVRAIAPGKVILDQVLPGFGRVLIIDHGERYYSLYGRLGKVVANMGEEIKAQQVIASLGSSDKLGRNFYFELRHKGKPQNPKIFLSQNKFAS